MPFRFALFIPLFLASCVGTSVYISPADRLVQEHAPPEGVEQIFEVYLVGDAGGSTASGSEPALRLLKTLVESADSNGAVVFLGDNIYCCGLPDSSASNRETAEMRIRAQAEAVQGYPGLVRFIPGNHDWGRINQQRVDLVTRQERFVESLFGDENVFMPDNGLPGPIDVKLREGLRLILLDTQWWMTETEKPYGESGSADIGEDADFILELDEIIKKRRKDNLLIVGHHPVRSNGSHGGHFSLKDHIFPLTVLNDNLYIPLPVIGSIYPTIRRLAGGPQDFSNTRYASYINALDALLKDHEGRVIYASGHEHSLQYFSEGSIHYVVSGTGSSATYVAPGNGARFTSDQEGLMRIRYFANGEIWLDALAADENLSAGRLLYRGQMEGPVPESFSEPVLVSEDERINIPLNATELRAADPSLDAGSLRSFFFGSEHRKAWASVVEFPVFDIGKEAGGLTPIKRGGSLQTTSVRLENNEGHQFVLRSVSKDPRRSLPPDLQRTLAADISIDQIAIMHPYAALLAARLADVTGVYHANPKLVIVPDDPRFGVYRDVVAGQLMLFEERPDENMSHAPNYGNSKDVIGTVSMFQSITGDNDDRVDEKHFVRSRLLDMYFSDWDRHSDQWRWATFPAEGNDGTIYRAIPRDRDWAFNFMNGLFPSITKLPFVIPKFQDFRETYGYLKGLNLNGMHLDRRFASELSKSDWIAVATKMQALLTDAEIDKALLAFPEPIYDIYADEYRRLLQIRRDKLRKAAEEYYLLLAKLADVIGSDKHERFEVTRLDRNRTEVVVFKTSKDGEIRREFFRRVFLKSETKEIRLYGFGGNDTFVFKGDTPSGISIRAIGGTGADQFLDESTDAGKFNNVTIYDVPFQSTVQPGSSFTNAISTDPLVNRYNPKEFGSTHFMPALYPGSNPDDGLFIGGGGTFTVYGFRKLPYGSRHKLLANVSTRTSAFNFLYEGRFVDQFKGWDFGLRATARTPNNIRNYYGLGNESENSDSDATFYQARFSSYLASIHLLKTSGGFFEFYLGPTFERTEIERDTLRFVGQAQAGVSPTSFDDQMFIGLETGFDVDGRDSSVYPRTGIFWANSIHARAGIHKSSSNFTQFRSDFSLYSTPTDLRKLTIALRAGISHNVGDFPFYLSSTLGGKHSLRGWRSTRFAGRTSLYQNVEVRVELFRYSTVLAVGTAGILAFLDNGRVWTDGESSTRWHQGTGGGFWMNLFDLSVFSGTVGFSKEETTITIGLGLFY